MYRYYDLNVRCDVNDAENKIRIAEKLGWNGICFVMEFENNRFKDFLGDIDNLREKTEIEILSGALISAPSTMKLRRLARDALRCADLVIVDGGDGKVNRAASECWEVDILSHPEKNEERDFMRQKNSGIDHVIARLLAEKFIAIEFNFFEILNSSGMRRSQILGRMQQNVRLARKYNVPIIITSGAIDKYDLRSPRDLMSFGKLIGMTDLEAKSSILENPLKIVQKARDRKNPNILMKGLEVIEWGGQERREKRMYGWY